MTFLAIDVGNTRLKWAQYESPRRGARLLSHGAEFLENIDHLGERVWPQLVVPEHMYGCIVAGEGVKRRVEEQMELWDVHPQWVVPTTEAGGVTNGYDHPSRLGADRWVAMVGARDRILRLPVPKPVVVVMVGTAVTVDALDSGGRFLGGLILPGHGIMLRALESGTAGLHVPTGEVHMFPTNTSDALTSGGTYAIAGAVDRMVRHLRTHTGEEPVCVMSGGAGWKMAPHMAQAFELVDNLILEGLLAMAEERFATHR